MAEGNANTELNHDNWDEMTASSSKFEIQTCLDKKLTNFDEKKCHDVDNYPVNFSGVPHIGERIFGHLDFKTVVEPSAKAGSIYSTEIEVHGLNF